MCLRSNKGTVISKNVDKPATIVGVSSLPFFSFGAKTKNIQPCICFFYWHAPLTFGHYFTHFNSKNMPTAVTCAEFSYIGSSIEQSGLINTWLKNIDVTVFDDFPSLNTHLENEKLGIELSIKEDGSIETIFMFPHSPLVPPLSGTFAISRQALCEKLGKPFFSFEKDPNGEYDFYRRSNDKWVNEDKTKYITFTYTEDDASIYHITIGDHRRFN